MKKYLFCVGIEFKKASDPSESGGVSKSMLVNSVNREIENK